jgi:5-methylcytosine-specific restriction enzyme A
MRRAWSTTVRMRVLDRFERKCQLCFGEIGTKGFDLDHAIPLAMNGEDTEANMRPLCIPCHRLKTKGDVGDIARAKRREAKHLGGKAPSRNPIPGGRNTPWKKTFGRGAVRR